MVTYSALFQNPIKIINAYFFIIDSFLKMKLNNNEEEHFFLILLLNFVNLMSIQFIFILIKIK